LLTRGFVRIVDRLIFGQHLLMENAGNENATGFLPVKDHVLARVHASQSGANFITWAINRGIVSNKLAAFFKLCM
jgi:hypothetical protein